MTHLSTIAFIAMDFTMSHLLLNINTYEYIYIIWILYKYLDTVVLFAGSQVSGVGDFVRLLGGQRKTKRRLLVAPGAWGSCKQNGKE